MGLPSQYFDSEKPVSLDISGLESTGDFTSLINSGSMSLEDFDDKVLSSIPAPTISAPPVLPTPSQQGQQAPEVSTQSQPVAAEPGKLEEIEKLLLALDEQVKNLGAEPEALEQPKVNKNDELMDKMLNEPLSEREEGKIQVVAPEPNYQQTTEQPITREIFNKEKLKEIQQQREVLLKERESILQSFNNTFNNTEQGNQNISNVSNSEQLSNFSELNKTEQTTNNEISNKSDFTNIANIPQNTVDQNFSDIQNITNNLEAEPKAAQTVSQGSQEPGFSSISNISNEEILGDSFYTENQTTENTFNSSPLSVMPETSLESTPTEMPSGGAPEFTNSSEIPDQQPQEIPFISTPEEQQKVENAFIPQGEMPQESLPPAQDAMGENAKNITDILASIREGINKLNDGLNSNFSNLNQSMQGIKSSVVNNSTYNSGGQKSESPSTNNNTQQRTTMPDYRGDYPEKTDFPPGFDVTKLGGTNLPNPQSIR